MSDNVHNDMIDDPIIDNIKTFAIRDLKIEFVKHFLKVERNEFLTNRIYNYYPILDTDNTYPDVEFTKKDPIGYIKLKGKELWLHDENNNKVFFDHVRTKDFYYRQPLVVWFEYIRERMVIVYRLTGYNVEKIMKKIYDPCTNSKYLPGNPVCVQGTKLTNVSYLKYKEIGGQIYIEWVDDPNQATKFVYDAVKWNEFGWIKLEDKQAQRKKLSNKYQKST